MKKTTEIYIGDDKKYYAEFSFSKGCRYSCIPLAGVLYFKLPVHYSKKFATKFVASVMKNLPVGLKGSPFYSPENLLFLGEPIKVAVATHYAFKNMTLNVASLETEDIKKSYELLALEEFKKAVTTVENELHLNEKRHTVKLTRSPALLGRNAVNRNLISLNTVLLSFPFSIIRTIIVHELLHDLYQNHGKDFYNAMKKYAPDYKEHQQLISRGWY